MNGLLIVDKPKGITSQSVCLRIKHSLGVKKVGHNGTLDPNATGVMVVAIDQATKTLRLVNEHDKEYIATILFGVDTDTLDMDGNVIRTMDMNPSMDEIKKNMDILLHQETQIPPLTSAVKVNGKKLYEYQRQGIEIEPEPREVTLKEYEILSDVRKTELGYEIDIRIAVSKGYFVRSMARDLGKLLGGCAVIHELRRTKSGIYSIENAVKLEDISPDSIVSILDFFDLPKVMVKDYMIPLVKNGITMDSRQTDVSGVFYVDSSKGILGIYEETSPKIYKPVVLFGV